MQAKERLWRWLFKDRQKEIDGLTENLKKEIVLKKQLAKEIETQEEFIEKEMKPVVEKAVKIGGGWRYNTATYRVWIDIDEYVIQNILIHGNDEKTIRWMVRNMAAQIAAKMLQINFRRDGI